MSSRQHYVHGKLILPDRILPDADFIVEDGRLLEIGSDMPVSAASIDLHGQYVAPGFIDLHVHGGAGADFMDLTEEAFRTVCQCHLRHGTTSFTPTSTVAQRHEYTHFLELCDRFFLSTELGTRILGGHLYGPYFHPPAKGCHPDADFLKPDPSVDQQLLDFAGTGLVTMTIAPETPGTETLVQAARQRNVRVCAGHTYATFSQMEEAVRWGVQHVDHLFCAMSDRARLRQKQAFPMRAGVMEATLYFDELTTEVIADGWHLAPELLRLAHKIKGPDRLALVTDSMRALDCPDGEYWFGAMHTGEKIRRLGDVGVTLDGTGLASGVLGMDQCVQNFAKLTDVPLAEVIRMASLTPARILGIDDHYGSLAVGKIADFVVLDSQLEVQQVFQAGQRRV